LYRLSILHDSLHLTFALIGGTLVTCGPGNTPTQCARTSTKTKPKADVNPIRSGTLADTEGREIHQKNKHIGRRKAANWGNRTIPG